MEKSAKTFGRLKFVPSDRKWVVSGLAPNIALRIKDVFRRINKVSSGEFTFPDDNLHCHELLWFMDRYPLVVDTFDLARLKKGRKSYINGVAEVEKIFAPDYKAPEFIGLAENCSLWEYQAQYVDMFHRVKRILLGDDVGLGKTNSALGCLLDPESLPAAVIVQAHLPEQWEERIEEFTNLRVHVIKTVAPYDLPEADVYIYSYSKIHGWTDVVKARPFRTVILDEPQELRGGFSTNKGAAAKTFCDLASGVMGLSATPVMNYGIEMYHIMQFISPGCLGTLDEFLREWCTDAKIVADPDALGAYLRESHLMLRRTESDVGLEMPPPNVTLHEVEYDEVVAAASEDLAYRLAITATSGGFMERGQAYRELDALARHTTGVAKAKGVADYVKILLDAGLPVILSGWHREVYDIWQEELKDYKPVMYTGSESKKAKRIAKQKFVSGETNLMIISNRSGAGLDGLQHRCTDVVIGEIDWSWGVLKQLIGRVRRRGQSSQVNAHYMVANGGSDPLMIEVLGVKANQAHGIMNPGQDPIAPVNDTDRMKKLAQMVLDRRANTLSGSQEVAA